MYPTVVCLWHDCDIADCECAADLCEDCNVYVDLTDSDTLETHNGCTIVHVLEG